MVYFFKDANVLIDGSPVLCQNASVSFDNSLQPVYPIGFQGIYNQIPSSAIRSSFQLSYLMRMDKDPTYDVIVNLKNYLPQGRSSIVIGNLSGEAFLDSYGIKSTPNQPNQVSVSYAGYLPLSGALQAKLIELNNSGNFTGISHSWVTYLGNSGNIQTTPIFDLDYSFRANWLPTFTLGKTTPLQVDFTNASEEIRFTTENFNNLSFSGTELTDQYVDASITQYLILYGLALLTNNDQSRAYTFDILNSKITKTNLSAAPDSIVTTEVTAVKYF